MNEDSSICSRLKKEKLKHRNQKVLGYRPLESVQFDNVLVLSNHNKIITLHNKVIQMI